jgi:hypothetical protein
MAEQVKGYDIAHHHCRSANQGRPDTDENPVHLDAGLFYKKKPRLSSAAVCSGEVSRRLKGEIRFRRLRHTTAFNADNNSFTTNFCINVHWALTRGLRRPSHVNDLLNVGQMNSSMGISGF